MSTSFRFTIEEYERMHSSGVFSERGDVRVELLYGEVVEVNPPNPPHAWVVDQFMYWSVAVTSGADIWVRIQNPVGIPEFDSLPEPDIAWLKKRDYRRTQPTPDDVLLIVEVSDTTLDKDRKLKGKLYAEAGIQEYWIGNVNEACIEVYRRPVGGWFQSLETYVSGQHVSPIAMPNVQLSVADIMSF